jgi:hypothetical protein
MNIENSLLRSLAYFDLVDYPLTTVEAWRWQWQGASTTLLEIDKTLRRLHGQGRVEKIGPWWCLPGRSHLANTRQERHLISINKIRLAKKFTKLCSFMPTVEGVAVANTAGYRNAQAASDLDFFIITKPGTIWLTRFVLTVLAILSGRRPTPEHSADTLCLSFFVTSDSLDLASLQLKDGDPYLVWWTSQLTPLFGRGEIWSDFLAANQWVKTFLPNCLSYQPNRSWLYQVKYQPNRFIISLLKLWEPMARRWQLQHLPTYLKTKARLGDGGVVINDRVLKFHSNDKRAQFRDRWVVHTQELKISYE